jgi:hypothetical protein
MGPASAKLLTVTRARTIRLALLAGHATCLALVAPLPVLAADPPVVEGTPGAAPLLVMLLLGSLTAGIFFASPLRRRISGRARVDSTVPPAVASAARPLTALLSRGQRVADMLLDAVGHQIERRAPASGGSSREPDQPQLPPMLGGDIFFDAEPRPRVMAPPASSPSVSRPALARDVRAPWSTGEMSDDRYSPNR